jgi:phospholysine phosphohistidine inorganic pyrophosphate phosphatase
MGLDVEDPFGVLLDIDGVLYVGDDPIEGAADALAQLRRIASALRLLTNTTSRPRRAIHEHLLELGFDVKLEEILTPAALAVRHCEQQGYTSVRVLTSEALDEDLAPLGPFAGDGPVHAIVLGDLGEGFTSEVLNSAFRQILDGAELIALQHNRYWRSDNGLVMDVGAYAAALEYATSREAFVVGKPSGAFFEAAIADMGLERAVMVGDDVEADVGGAIAAGIPGVLVRTGKFRTEALEGDITPTAVVDSVADVPELLRRR